MPANPIFTEFLCQSELRLDAVAASALGAQMWPVKLRAHEFLFHQGDPCEHFYVLFQGSVDVQASSVEGQELLFTTLRPGAPIGEATVVSGDQRTASIRARTDATVLCIDRASFLRLARDHPDLSLALARLAAETLRRLSTRVERGAFTDLDERLIELLLDLIKGQRGNNDLAPLTAVDQPAPIELHITQQSLAKQLGVTRESVNKHLGRLAQRQLIQIGRGRITIPDPGLLATTVGH